MASAASQRLRRLGVHLRQHGGARPPTPPHPSSSDEPGWAAVDVEFGEAAAIGRLEGGANPLGRLSRGDVPAVILRRAMPQAECAGLIRRFAERGMLPPAFLPFVAQDLAGSVGFSGGSKWVGLEETGTDPEAAAAERLDIGTALGNLGGDQDAFFADAERSHDIYASLFEGLPTQPIDLMCECSTPLPPFPTSPRLKAAAQTARWPR